MQNAWLIARQLPAADGRAESYLICINSLRLPESQISPPRMWGFFQSIHQKSNQVLFLRHHICISNR
jgi:hypothetical protein